MRSFYEDDCNNKSDSEVQTKEEMPEKVKEKEVMEKEGDEREEDDEEDRRGKRRRRRSASGYTLSPLGGWMILPCIICST